MRRPVAWLLGALALLGFLKRRPATELDEPAAPDAPDPRAEELRRKLDESRALVHEREEFEAAEPTVDRTEHAPEDPERRRRDVHAAGRDLERQMRRRS